jgi:hypothetical protein
MQQLINSEQQRHAATQTNLPDITTIERTLQNREEDLLRGQEFSLQIFDDNNLQKWQDARLAELQSQAELTVKRSIEEEVTRSFDLSAARTQLAHNNIIGASDTERAATRQLQQLVAKTIDERMPQWETQRKVCQHMEQQISSQLAKVTRLGLSNSCAKWSQMLVNVTAKVMQGDNEQATTQAASPLASSSTSEASATAKQFDDSIWNRLSKEQKRSVCQLFGGERPVELRKAGTKTNEKGELIGDRMQMDKAFMTLDDGKKKTVLILKVGTKTVLEASEQQLQEAGRREYLVTEIQTRKQPININNVTIFPEGHSKKRSERDADEESKKLADRKGKHVKK